MKGRYLLLGIVLSAQLALAFWPLIPFLKPLIPANPTAREQLDWQILIIGLEFALFTFCIGAVLLSQERQNGEFQTEVRQYLPVTNISQIRGDHFYADFLCAAKKATHSVNIMYLARVSPDQTNDPGRLGYYRELMALISRRQDVHYRRIMRLTPDTKPWIQKLIVELKGTSNASVAYIKESETEDMSLSLSVQIIDADKVWFVAVKGHEQVGPFRDLFVENSQIADAMNCYYDRLWRRGRVLLDAGRITQDGDRFLEA